MVLLSGIFGCVIGTVEVGEVHVLGHLFDVAAVRHEPSSSGHHEPGLACSGVAVMSLGQGQVAVVECDRFDSSPVRPQQVPRIGHGQQCVPAEEDGP